jgi:hypothetical protein
VNDTIGGFIRGQSAICLILSLAYALTLTLIGLNHGLLIGLMAGVISFVPYLGSLTALVVSMCVAIAQFWPSWTQISLVAATFFVGQILADHLLSPYFVGRSVNLHPVWLMFALFAFGYLFGFPGLLIAVPLAGAVGVLMRFALRRYLASSLYAANSGGGGTPPADPPAIFAGATALPSVATTPNFIGSAGGARPWPGPPTGPAGASVQYRAGSEGPGRCRPAGQSRRSSCRFSSLALVAVGGRMTCLSA